MSFAVPHDAVLVADGGLATELEARGNDLSDSLWSARLLMDAPEQIRDAHLAFFRAGAMIATSASYQASFEGFARRGLDRRDAAGLMRRSVDLARAARAEMAGDGQARWVAASVGPYGAALADGSEYRGRYGLSVRELAAWHRPRLEVLAEAGPDVLALETVPDIDEAEALMTAVTGLGIPAWLSYSIAGERTRAGQSLAEAFAVAASVPEVVSVGVNCCEPADVLTAITAAREVTGKPVIVYPKQRRGLGCPAARLDGAVPVLRRAAAAVDSGGRENRGRVLPGPARRHRGDRQGRGGRRPCARQLRLSCPAVLTAGSASSAYIKIRYKYNQAAMGALLRAKSDYTARRELPRTSARLLPSSPLPNIFHSRGYGQFGSVPHILSGYGDIQGPQTEVNREKNGSLVCSARQTDRPNVNGGRALGGHTWARIFAASLSNIG